MKSLAKVAAVELLCQGFRRKFEFIAAQTKMAQYHASIIANVGNQPVALVHRKLEMIIALKATYVAKFAKSCAPIDKLRFPVA
jgi:hypothetical protein